jgi:trimeric autotransporter adhesin
MSQTNVNIIAPLGYTGPALTGDSSNVGIINSAGQVILKTTSNDNTSLGREALESSTGGLNTAIGGYALQLNTTGTLNTAVGIAAGGGNISGVENVFIGRQSGQYNATGNENTVVGHQAGFGQDPFGSTIGMGNNNTCVGAKTGYQLTGSDNNTFIGKSAGFGVTTGNNNVCLGFNSQPPQITTSNSITLGNSSNDLLRCAVQVITGLSDARDKKDITDLRAGLDFVKGLRPVEFVWNDREEYGKHDVADFGFIAQDLKAAQEDAELADVLKLVYESNPEKLEASYGKLVPILVKAVQELAAKFEQLENK